MAKKKKSVAKKKAPAKKPAKKAKKVKAPMVQKQKPEPVPKDAPVEMAPEAPVSDEKHPVVHQPAPPSNLEQVEKEIIHAADRGKEVEKKGFWARLFGK